MKKMIKALVLVMALALVLAGCQYLPGTQQGHTHTLVHFDAKAPTCVNNGILEHWYCPGCNARFSDEAATTEVTFADLEVEETGHKPGTDDGDCTTDVMCTVCDGIATKGNAKHTPEKDDGDCTTNVMCTQCAKVAIPGKPAHEANEDDGDCTTAVTCKHCDHVFVPAAEAHTPGDAATCTTAQACTVCNKVLVEALGHRLENWIALDPTCTEPGYTAHQRCARCDYTTPYVEIAPKHTPGAAATCTTAQTCTVCETVLVEALGHADANEDAKCDTCGKFFLPEVGTAFKLTLFQNKKGAKYYFTGAMSGYYFATSTDVSKAVDVYLEDAEGGYYMYFMSGETKNYIYGEKASNGKFNIKFGATKSVWTYDYEMGIFKTVVSGTTFYMGTYGTYVTINISKISYINASNVDKEQFAARPVVVAAADAE